MSGSQIQSQGAGSFYREMEPLRKIKGAGADAGAVKPIEREPEPLKTPKNSS